MVSNKSSVQEGRSESEKLVSGEDISSSGSVVVVVSSQKVVVVVVVLGRDGEIRRMGASPRGPNERGLYQGYTDGSLLDDALQALPPGFYDSLGHFSHEEQVGAPMTLTVALRTADGEELPYIIEYGSESTGPSQDLVAFFLHALAVTQPWYDAQRNI